MIPPIEAKWSDVTSRWKWNICYEKNVSSHWFSGGVLLYDFSTVDDDYDDDDDDDDDDKWWYMMIHHDDDDDDDVDDVDDDEFS